MLFSDKHVKFIFGLYRDPGRGRCFSRVLKDFQTEPASLGTNEGNSYHIREFDEHTAIVYPTMH